MSAATATASTEERNDVAPEKRLGYLLWFLLRRGVVIHGSSEVWKEPVLNDSAWPDKLQKHLAPLDGPEYEREVVRLLHVANADSKDDIIRDLCPLPKADAARQDASSVETMSQDVNVERLKNQLMLLVWDTRAVTRLPESLDADDLHCSAVAGYCMAVVRGDVQVFERPSLKEEEDDDDDENFCYEDYGCSAKSVHRQIAKFWNDCVRTLNAHCTKRPVLLVAAAALAYATDCLIEWDTDQVVDTSKSADGPLTLEQPESALTRFVPALGECWACLCARTNRGVADAIDFVLKHDLSLAKLVSAYSKNFSDDSNSFFDAVVDKLAAHLGYEFEFKASIDWWTINPDDPNARPQARPCAVPSDLAALADKTLFPSNAKFARSKLFHMVAHMNSKGWLPCPDGKLPDIEKYLEVKEEGIVEVVSNDFSPRRPYLSATRVLLAATTTNDSVVPSVDAKDVVLPSSLDVPDGKAQDLQYVSQSCLGALARRWRGALLCLHASSTCLFRANTRAGLVGHVHETTDHGGVFLETTVKWTDGKTADHCAFRDVIQELCRDGVVAL